MAASHSLRQRTRPVFRAGFFRRWRRCRDADPAGAAENSLGINLR